jgi:hypothetical protein
MKSTIPTLLDKDIVERLMHLTPYDIDHALLHAGFKPYTTISCKFLGLELDRSFAYETTFIDGKGELRTGKVYVSAEQKPITKKFYYTARY